jgi:hypothetical protein
MSTEYPVSGTRYGPVTRQVEEHAGPASRAATASVLSGRLLFGALLLVLAMSPFEAGYPPLARFWATFTNLEIALFGLAVAWVFRLAVDRGARTRLTRLPLLVPIAALIGATALSTLFGEFRSLGVQSIYRLLMGVVVYASAVEALRDGRRMLRALGTLVGAGTISAVLGLLEFANWVNVEPWLRMFKPQPTTVGGMLRLSGTFEYANGAAMYFEMLLPVLIGLVLLCSSGSLPAGAPAEEHAPMQFRRWVLWVLYPLVGLYTVVLILTFSRAAWAGIGVAVSVICLILIVRYIRAARAGEARQVAGMFRPIALAVLMMAVGAVYVSLTQPLLWLRLTGENDRSWYANTIIPQALPPMAAGEGVTVTVTLHNDGPMVWRAERVPVVHLSYHWMSADRSHYVVFEGERSPLPRDVQPGESVTIEAFVLAPTEAGRYYLQWDLVQEDVTWFSAKTGTGTEPALYTIAPRTGTTRPPKARPHPPISVQAFSNTDTSTVPRSRLWRVAFDMFRAHPLFGVGPDGFRNLYGRYAGVSDWNRNIYTNNTYIEMFTNLGLVGGLAFLLLTCMALWRALRGVLKSPVNGLWILSVALTASLVAFFSHGLVDYFLFSTPMYVLFWFVMSQSAREGRAGDGKALPTPLFPATTLALMLSKQL